MSISQSRLKELFLVLFLKVVLEWTYVDFVYPLYEYMGFSLEPNLIKLVESYIFVILLFFFLPQDERKISTVGVQLLFLLMIVPILSLYGLINGPRLFVYFFISGFGMTTLMVRIVSPIRITTIKDSNFILFLVLGVVSFFVYTMLIKLNGIPNFNALTLSSVYDIRQNFYYGSRIMGYLFKWQGNVINCFFIGLAYSKRQYLVFVLVFGFQVLLFLICAHKSFLFSPFLVLWLLYAIKRGRVMMLTLVCLILVVVFCFALQRFEVSNMPASVVIRRGFFVPARVSFWYYDFFSENEHVYLSQSKMSLGLFYNPYEHYDMSIANIMGMIYADNPRRHMNTGYIGNAYMHFGFVGMLIFSVIFGMILIVIDSICRKKDISIAMGAVGIPIVSLLNGGFFSVMLTNGFLMGLVVIWLHRENSNRRFVFPSICKTWQSSFN